MKLLSNANQLQGHLYEICNCLAKYKKAYVAVAFLKMSGLKLINDSLDSFLNRGGELHFIAGQNFALTDPEALYNIFHLLKSRPESNLYIYKAESNESIFHPKMYLFESEHGCNIIFGSANMTNGGLLSNNEMSLSVECQNDSDIWKQSIAIFNNYVSNSSIASLLTIGRYKTFYDSQKSHNKAAKVTPPKYEYTFDYDVLKKYPDQLPKTELTQMFSERDNGYWKSRKILNKIADYNRLTKAKFIPLLDSLVVNGAWHSGSLYRRRKSIYKYYKEFAQLVRFIRTNKYKSPEYVFSEAMKLVAGIDGASVNYVTEIMASYNRNDFAILNRNPFTVLSEKAGVSFKRKTLTSFNGNHYADFCALVKEISEELGFSNMLEADSFFNDIYWKIKSSLSA